MGLICSFFLTLDTIRGRALLPELLLSGPITDELPTLTMDKTAFPPKAQGLYDPRNEHENCGIGLIVDMKGRKSHDIVKGALEICVNLDHRGGLRLRSHNRRRGRIVHPTSPQLFQTGLSDGMRVRPSRGGRLRRRLRLSLERRGRTPERRKHDSENRGGRGPANDRLARRPPSAARSSARPPPPAKPFMRQFFVERNAETERGLPFERKLYIVRRVATHRIRYNRPR